MPNTPSLVGQLGVSSWPTNPVNFENYTRYVAVRGVFFSISHRFPFSFEIAKRKQTGMKWLQIVNSCLKVKKRVKRKVLLASVCQQDFDAFLPAFLIQSFGVPEA